MTATDHERYQYTWRSSPSRGHAVAVVPDRLGDPVLINRAGRWLTLCSQGPFTATDLRPVTETDALLCAICLSRFDELAFTQPREDAHQ